MKSGDRIVFTQPTTFAHLGDEGYIISKKSNGWLKVRICKTGLVFNVRNTPYTISLYSHFAQNAKLILHNFY